MEELNEVTKKLWGFMQRATINQKLNYLIFLEFGKLEIMEEKKSALIVFEKLLEQIEG